MHCVENRRSALGGAWVEYVASNFCFNGDISSLFVQYTWQLKAYVGAGHSPEECAAELERLGGVDAIVCGAMLTGRSGEDFAKVFFFKQKKPLT
jgi:hypothetical protein